MNVAMTIEQAVFAASVDSTNLTHSYMLEVERKIQEERNKWFAQRARDAALVRNKPYEALHEEAISMLWSNSALHSMGADEVGEEIHAALELGESPTPGTIGKYIALELSRIKTERRMRLKSRACLANED